MATRRQSVKRQDYHAHIRKASQRWTSIAAVLPCGMANADKQGRMRMFTEVDGNGNGFLSLVEVQRAIRKKMGDQDARDFKGEVERAFDEAKASKAKKGMEAGDAFVDRKEFREMLVHLKRHFFWALVASLGSVFAADDHQIDQTTFKHVVDQLSGWGVVNVDLAAEFHAIDDQKPFEYRRTGERPFVQCAAPTPH